MRSGVQKGERFGTSNVEIFPKISLQVKKRLKDVKEKQEKIEQKNAKSQKKKNRRVRSVLSSLKSVHFRNPDCKSSGAA